MHIYPLPSDGGLGIHATADVGGTVRFGPDVEWLAAPSSPSFAWGPQANPLVISGTTAGTGTGTGTGIGTGTGAGTAGKSMITTIDEE